ncbi:MAG: electron transfer flavoprotein subunit beta/FixA family protein [candidate division Zixibacteria bacterium]|nr:electron transfer flavoprotein subunit beta/FixA family protein [candidate division Zixibacteria bacterium]
MNTIVCIKRVPDTETRIQISTDGKNIERRDVSFVLNPYDEYAIEEALRLKEQFGGETTVICLGPADAVQVLRNAVALGADHAILLKTEQEPDATQTATALADAIAGRKFDVVFLGKQAVDGDNAQIGPMVAERLELPCICQVIRLEAQSDRLTVNRQIEGGEEIVETTLPVVLTAQKGLNQPRLASLKDIMRARRTPIEEREAVLVSACVETVALAMPPQRQAGRFIGKGVEDVAELVRRLREEANVL